MRFFSFDSPLMRFLNKLANIMMVNLCFVVCCLPVITVGASVTAMYRCFLTMAKDGDISPFKLFFSSFKENFKKATLLELCCLPAVAVVVVEVLAYMSGIVGNGGWTVVMYFLPFIIISCILSYVFPLQAQFENTVKGTIKNSFILALSHFPVTIIITALNLVFPALFCYRPDLLLRTLILWLLLGFALVAYLNTSFLRRVFLFYFPEDEDSGEAAEEAPSEEE